LRIAAQVLKFFIRYTFYHKSVNEDTVFVSLVNNQKGMKNRIVFIAVLLFICWAANSCEAISGCKVCQDITYENGKEVFSTPETEYCGDQLIAKESTADVTIGNQTIKVKCQ